MTELNRRDFLRLAAAMGATLAFGCSHQPSRQRIAWTERRDLYPQGVASGDPDSNSVLLWTRRPYDDGRSDAQLDLEVASDPAFENLVATQRVRIASDADWTCRVLVAGLKPASEYWYRFADDSGAGSRVGRTLTAPTDDDARPVKFAFVSCQNIQEGAQNGYRRMIWEDQRAAPAERIGFVLHLGDFVYEVVQYEEDYKPGGRYTRRMRFPFRYAGGKKVVDRFWVPTTLADYRLLYNEYLKDPDIQDARAHFPFVCMWDNHEFSWQGWQSITPFGAESFPGQTLKVFANQVWFEMIPARVSPPGGSLERFVAPEVKDVVVETFDDNGLGTEPNNLVAINSLIAYRALRWGRHVDLILTDQHSFRSFDPTNREEATPSGSPEFMGFYDEEVSRVIDAGRAYNGGNPPATLTYDGKTFDNFRRNEAPQTILGVTQKKWFLERLRASQATWKVWGNSQGALDWRIDPQNLPEGIFPKKWPGGYASYGTGDWGTAYHERGEIYDTVKDAGITGFAIVSGDRHQFWAGYAAKDLPPRKFEPVGVSFVVGSLSSVNTGEALEKALKDNPARALFMTDINRTPIEPSINLLVKHGVRSALEYSKTLDLAKAHAVSNPDHAPHMAFVDTGGHGYATVRCDANAMTTEFVCTPRPIERSETDDGGPLRYRVRHVAQLWNAGEAPKLEQIIVEGDVGTAT